MKVVKKAQTLTRPRSISFEAICFKPIAYCSSLMPLPRKFFAFNSISFDSPYCICIRKEEAIVVALFLYIFGLRERRATHQPEIKNRVGANETIIKVRWPEWSYLEMETLGCCVLRVHKVCRTGETVSPPAKRENVVLQ